MFVHDVLTFCACVRSQESVTFKDSNSAEVASPTNDAGGARVPGPGWLL